MYCLLIFWVVFDFYVCVVLEVVEVGVLCVQQFLLVVVVGIVQCVGGLVVQCWVGVQVGLVIGQVFDDVQFLFWVQFVDYGGLGQVWVGVGGDFDLFGNFDFVFYFCGYYQCVGLGVVYEKCILFGVFVFDGLQWFVQDG